MARGTVFQSSTARPGSQTAILNGVLHRRNASDRGREHCEREVGCVMQLAIALFGIAPQIESSSRKTQQKYYGRLLTCFQAEYQQPYGTAKG